MKNCERLNKLPKEVQTKVIETLKAWTGCYVERHDDGHYEVSVGVGLTKGVQSFTVVESFKSEDIFTPEEVKKYADEVWSGCDMSAW